jgi:sterol desaturase/sphingolipid hydroxylase (fatty acid hydroxylase superfamily)
MAKLSSRHRLSRPVRLCFHSDRAIEEPRTLIGHCRHSCDGQRRCILPREEARLNFAVILLLDLLRYLVHRCEHAVPLFWRFHALHHSDPDVDVTTAVRHHPIEYVLASAVYWLAVLVLDVPAIVALTHGLAVFGTAAVQHGNIRLPSGLERWLQPALITTDLHRIHHSVSFDQANSNYGAVLSVWDRLFGTYTRISRSEHERIVFGVRELPRRDALKPSAMFLTPWLISRARAG